jgi:DNA-binding PadR family transcriptional regulator
MPAHKKLPAKKCFSHIGGKLGSLLIEHFIEKEWVVANGRTEKHFSITEKGKKEFEKLGIDLSQIKEELV